MEWIQIQKKVFSRNSVNSIWKCDAQDSDISYYEFQNLQKNGRFEEKEYKLKKIRP